MVKKKEHILHFKSFILKLKHLLFIIMLYLLFSPVSLWLSGEFIFIDNIFILTKSKMLEQISEKKVCWHNCFILIVKTLSWYI